jgi:hypothetical protein
MTGWSIFGGSSCISSFPRKREALYNSAKRWSSKDFAFEINAKALGPGLRRDDGV